MPHVSTKMVISVEQLKDLFGEDDIPTWSTVQVCDGEWRIEPDGSWRFWRDSDI